MALLVGSAYVWSGPRSHVPVPGSDATPVEVVTAYLTALEERDFEPPTPSTRRPTRFGGIHELHATSEEGGVAHVTLLADIRGDASIAGENQWWGYHLERGSDDRWHIIDAGVA